MKSFLIKHIAVVAFLLTGISTLVTLTFIIGTNKGTLFQRVYTFKSVFNDTRGIYVGSEVTIHGVRTGNVEDAIILPDGRVEVTFTSQKKYSFMVNQSSYSELRTLGAIGDKYVNIVTSDINASPLENYSTIPSKSAPDVMSLFSGNEKGSVRSTVQSLEKFLLEATITLQKTNKLLTKIEQGRGSLGALINDRELYNRAIKLLGGRPKGYMQNLIKQSK